MSEQMAVNFETLLNGYTAAHGRFEKARLTQDVDATFHSLFETLNWSVVMDDHIGHHWMPEGEPLKYRWRDYLEDEEQAIVKGIRFARNRVHHQWADALQLSTGGVQFPVEFPIVFHEWSWISADKIPPGRNENENRGIDEYRSALQGHLVRLSLSTLEHAYRKMASEHLEQTD